MGDGDLMRMQVLLLAILIALTVPCPAAAVEAPLQSRVAVGAGLGAGGGLGGAGLHEEGCCALLDVIVGSGDRRVAGRYLGVGFGELGSWDIGLQYGLGVEGRRGSLSVALGAGYASLNGEKEYLTGLASMRGSLFPDSPVHLGLHAFADPSAGTTLLGCVMAVYFGDLP